MCVCVCVSPSQVKVTKHERCVIEVRVTGHTSSTDPADKGTKVKITGLMISDEGADMQAEGTCTQTTSWAALECV